MVAGWTPGGANGAGMLERQVEMSRGGARGGAREGPVKGSARHSIGPWATDDTARKGRRTTDR